MTLAEFGKLRGNYLADPENLFKLGSVFGCCTENNQNNCQTIFTGTVNNARKLASVTITHPDGTTITASTTLPVKQTNGKMIADVYGQIPVTNPSRIEEWLTKVLELFEYDIYLRVTYAGGVLTITHRGRATLSAITFDNASVMATPVPCCEIIPVRVWKFTGVDEIGDFNFTGGNPVELDNNPYAYTGTAADEVTAATLQDDVATALDSLGTSDGFTYIKTEVTINNASGGYTIKIWTLEDQPILVGTNKFSFCEMDEMFYCD